MMYIAMFGRFLALKTASSVLNEQRTNDVMDNSSVSNVGTGHAKVNHRG